MAGWFLLSGILICCNRKQQDLFPNNLPIFGGVLIVVECIQ